MDPGCDNARADAREAAQLRRPALLKARQWLEFLDVNAHKMPKDGIGWLAQIRDAVVESNLLVVIAARRLRKNPEWDIQGTMVQDTEKLEDQARRLLARVEAIPEKDVPVRLEFLWDSLKGAVKNQVRLAREIDKMQAEGDIWCDVTYERNSKRLVENG